MSDKTMSISEMDRLHEECGIVAIHNHPEAATLAYLGLYALQHRGQEASGIVTYDGERFYSKKGVGLVTQVFSEADLEELKGSAAIGHNRYATTGGSSVANIQPLSGQYADGELSMAHNGNLVNADALRDELKQAGTVFQSTTDSEVILHLIARSKEETLIGQMIDALQQVRGAYSLVFLSKEGIVGVRDPNGVRPLCLGRIKDGYAFASESCAFDLIGAEWIRDIEPGEMVHIHQTGIDSFRPFAKVAPAQCVFEYVYFARPDSLIFSRSAYGIRKRLGRELARESAGVAADLVIAVPDSGVTAALGFVEESHIPYDTGLIRNHYVGRTFIEPQEKIRHFGVKIKLNAVREVLNGKRVVVVDDSIVRGTTSRKIVKMIRDAGAKEVHMRVSSPQIVSPCFYGIDTPTHAELIASNHSEEEIRRYITADSLKYLSIDGMFRAVYDSDEANRHFCTACFTGNYPIPFPTADLVQLEMFRS